MTVTKTFLGATTRMQSATCTNCHKVVDAASGVGTDDSPDPGDFTICIYCGHLMVFADDLTLRELTEDEMVDVAGDRRLLAVQRARGAMVKEENKK
jgi:hypothetical protein